jgi:hypothetical protein
MGSARNGRIIGLACQILLAIAVIRMTLLVLHDPLLAFANQHDQVRTSACLSLWPKAADGQLVFGISNAAPYSKFEFHQAPEYKCFMSSAVVFAYGAYGNRVQPKQNNVK